MNIEVTGNILDIRDAARGVIAPPIDVLPYSAVAAEIIFPDGPRAQQRYDPDLDPVHAAVLHELEHGQWTRHVWVGGVQTGKSLLLTVTMLRVVTQLKQSLVYSQPTMMKIQEAWAGKISPIIDSSSFKAWLPDSGQGSRGGQQVTFQRFRDPKTNTRAGMFYFIAGGGGKEAAQAGTTAMWIFNDEVDSYPSRHRIDLIAKRADSFGRHARRIYTSTVKSDESSIILGMYEDSTRSRLYFKCPHCNQWGPLEWENVIYDNDDEIAAASSVRYVCTLDGCGVRWTENDRALAHQHWRVVHFGQTVEKDGTVTGPVPRTGTFGLLWTGLDSTIRSLAILAVEHLRAQKALDAGEHGPMRSFYRDQLCRMYEGEIAELELSGPLTWQKLLQRTVKEKWGPYRQLSDRDPEDPNVYFYSRRVCPPPAEATHSVVTIDVQANRCYWMVRAFNMDKTSWICAYGYDYSRIDHDNHNEAELHAMLDRVAAAVPSYCGETTLVLGGVDVGDNTDTVRRWIDARGGIWRAIKGHTNNMKAEACDVEGLVYFRDGVLLMQADNARDMFHSTFRRPVDAIGSTHIPYGLGAQDAALFKHLVSEQSAIDPDTKKKIIERGAGRNDWLDCGKMSEVLIYGFIQDQRAWEVKTPQPIRSQTKAGDEQGRDGPTRVVHSLQSSRPRYDHDGNPGINRTQRRSSRLMRW